jgi:hypothetical protein
VDKKKSHISTVYVPNALLLLEQLLGSRLFALLFSRIKKWHVAKLERTLIATGAQGEKLQVERRTDLTAEEFQREYLKKSRAVIFSGAASGWDCCQKWDLDHFSAGYGNNDLLLVDAEGLTTREKSDGFEFLTLRELIKNIKAGGDKYLRFSPLLHENPGLVRDLNLSWLAQMRGQNTFGNTYYMFLGGAGQKTLLHADQPCNLFVQVYGEKKWVLYYPEDSVFLYPELTNTAYVKSPLDIDNPEYSKFPLFKNATPHEAYLRPGDVLYVPPHVWHQVENKTDTIAVGFRFSRLRAALSSSVTFSLIRALSTNPSIWKTVKYGKQDTNLIWGHAAGKINEISGEKKRRQHAKGGNGPRT